jgi:hypothetical protein
MPFLRDFTRMVHWRRDKATVNSAPEENLPRLRTELSLLLGGRRCIVLGSAPDVSLPEHGPDDAIICANGSVFVAKRYNLSKPLLTVMSSSVGRANNLVRQQTLQNLAGCSTNELLLVESKGISFGATKAALEQIGFSYQDSHDITRMDRAIITEQILSSDIGGARGQSRISTGCFAAVLAAWAEAREIVLVGFSLTGGHSYIRGDTPRNHVGGDMVFFARSTQLQATVRTTSEILHEKFGIPLAA